ncbi:unnamed protein product [Urochloa decumbens]|uniref:Uncharacterized protein n=1 Tax=Urochloa decumbens TaxID=240449 RepID=A0ABC8ZHM9_9POAL
MAMEISLLRATAALLPSARARRIGSGRLPLATLPGHGAVVLAGRRVGTGRGRVLPELNGDVMRVKASGSESGLESGDQASEEPQNTVISGLGNLRRLWGPLLLFEDSSPPEYLTQKQSLYQHTLRKIGNLSYNLVSSVATHLNPQFDSPLFWRLLQVGYIFLGVSETDVYSRVSISLLKALHDLRRIVSEECKISLSSEVPEADSARASGSMDSDDEMMAMVAAFYKRVKADVECMLEASTRLPPSTTGGGDADSAPVA